MWTNPLVSLVLPIHGEVPFLKETIQSITKVSYQNLEVICVLDRASLPVEEYLKEFVANQANWKTVHSLLPGISNALNLGISKSSGSWIARIDSDDLIHPDRISKQVETIKFKKNIVLVGTQMTIVDVNGKQIGRTFYPIRTQFVKRLLRIRNCIGHPTVLFSKSVFHQTDGYRPQLDGAEDLDLWIRMLDFGDFVNLNEELTSYRISANQQTNNLKKNPGLMDEIVRLSNSPYGKDFLFELEQLESKSDLKKLVDKKLLEISKTTPSYVNSLKASRNLWIFESSFKERQIRSLYYLVAAISLSPINSAIYVIYAFRLKVFGGRKNDIT
jgi:glycosyltransferase involved in cell wall biosynthesis